MYYKISTMLDTTSEKDNKSPAEIKEETMALHVLDEANRCLGCKKPLCQQGCPIHTNIP